MKLPLTFWLFAIAGFTAPALAGQQSEEVGWGQGARGDSVVLVVLADNYILGRCKVSELGSGAEILPTFHGDDYLYTYPTPIVTTQNLLADVSLADVGASGVTLQTEAQGLLDYALTLTEGAELMFIMDIPNVPPQQAPIVLVQADTSGAGTTPQPDYILKYCKETLSIGNPRSAMRAVSPAGMLAVYLERYKGAQFIDLAEIKNITLLENTKHGELISEVSNNGLVGYRYDAEPKYEGADRAVFMAEYQGVRYKIVVDLKVFIAWDEDFPECPEPQLIKVNGKPVSGSTGYHLTGSGLTPHTSRGQVLH